MKYSTIFPGTEAPISEGGHWQYNGLVWTPVNTAGGLAFGTQTGSGGFDDSYSYLTGAWAPNQSAQATIHLEGGVAATYAETEILLRWNDSPNVAFGYEANLAYNAQYTQLIRWLGPKGTSPDDFEFLTEPIAVTQGVNDGDIFQADIVGYTITVRLNGVIINQATDAGANVPTGNPGVGFYWEGGPATSKYAFSEFSATDGIETTPPRIYSFWIA